MDKHSKEMARKSHKILTHFLCLIEDLEDVKANAKEATDFLEQIDVMIPMIENVIDSTFEKSTYLRSKTYLQDMQNKFETVIRKNYETIDK